MEGVFREKFFSFIKKKVKNQKKIFDSFKDNTFSIVHTNFYNTSSLTLAAKHKSLPKISKFEA